MIDHDVASTDLSLAAAQNTADAPANSPRWRRRLRLGRLLLIGAPQNEAIRAAFEAGQKSVYRQFNAIGAILEAEKR